MEKVKITKEQAERLNKLFKEEKTLFYDMVKMKYNGFNHTPNRCLNTLSMEDFCTALLFGYEVEIPPAPTLRTDKISLEYNNHPKHLTKGNEIYIYVKNCGYSIEEAEEIINKLTALVSHYNQYVKQGE